MNFAELRKLALAAVKADKNAPVAYTVSDTESYSTADLNDALRAELSKMTCDYRSFRENKNTIFSLIEETLDEVLPQRVLDQYMQFADVRTIPQGDTAVFHRRISEVARQRAKTFVTAVGLAARYETFMLDGTDITVKTNAVGAAARIGFEEFLDGRIQLSDLVDIVMEGMDDYIYLEIVKALESAVASLPAANKATFAGFDESTMDDLLSIADSYGRSTIYCTFEFASKMLPADKYFSDEMKSTLWKRGYLGDYKGHTVVIMPQSLTDATNTTKVIDPSQAYIIPTGSEKPVKIVFEGQTAVRTVEDNDDWSTDMQWYKKIGVAVMSSVAICTFQNTALTKATRH